MPGSVRRPALLAVVKLAGINPYVEVSPRVLVRVGLAAKAAVLVKVFGVASGRRGRAGDPERGGPVRDAGRLRAIARLGPGTWFRTTLVPSRTGPTRLYLDQWMRETAGVGVGDRVRVILRPDRAPRRLPVPTVLGRALTAVPGARAAWDALAPSRRREMLSYLNFLKTAAARERTVRKIVLRLRTITRD